MKNTSDTYHRIIASAQKLIHASSYSDIGVAAICEKANVQKGSFYHFFSSKQKLTLAVIDKNIADTKEKIIDKAFNSALSPMTRLQTFFSLMVERQVNIHEETGHVHGCPLGNLATEMATQDESIRTKLDRSFSALLELISQTLQEAIDNNELDHVNDVALTAQAMFAYFEGALLLAKTHNDPKLLKQLIPATLTIRL